MKSRTRIFAALLALFALAASFTEQVWASTCSQTEMAPPATMAGMGAPAAGQVELGQGQEMPMPGHGQGRRSHMPASDDCPLRAVAASGCVFFSFPAAETSVPHFTPAPLARLAPATDAMRDLLLVFPPFHPPQA